MSQIDNLIQRLEKVKGRNGSWTACCPAHDDRGPSLAVRELDDGRILLHCFAGCSTHSVLTALGMDMTDLFPPGEYKPGQGKPPVKPAFYASDLLRVIAFEALVVQIAAFDMANGKTPSETDQQRLMQAYQRIEEATRYANV